MAQKQDGSKRRTKSHRQTLSHSLAVALAGINWKRSTGEVEGRAVHSPMISDQMVHVDGIGKGFAITTSGGIRKGNICIMPSDDMQVLFTDIKAGKYDDLISGSKAA